MQLCEQLFLVCTVYIGTLGVYTQIGVPIGVSNWCAGWTRQNRHDPNTNALGLKSEDLCAGGGTGKGEERASSLSEGERQVRKRG